MTNPYLIQLSSFIAEHGIHAAETELQQLAGMARRRGVGVTAANVMADRSATPVVRERAFAMVCSALTAPARSPVFELQRAS